MSEEKKRERLYHAVKLERDAHELRAEKKIYLAFHAFDKAGKLFREAGDSFKAAICFASAATCWNQHTGHQSHQQAASRSESAAFVRRSNLKITPMPTRFSAKPPCFMRKKQIIFIIRVAISMLKMPIWQGFGRLFQPGKPCIFSNIGLSQRVKALLQFIPGLLSKLIWGYGEKPGRTLMFNFL